MPLEEPAPGKSPPAPSSRDRRILLLFGLILGLYLWNLGAVELSDMDEARSGVVVRDMVEGGRWLLPRTPDGYLSEKPPAYYGACAGLAALFGPSEWVLRGVSVAAALATLAVVFGWVRLFGSSRAALVSVVALASNLIFLRWARQAMVDAMLTFFLAAGLAAYFAARAGRLGAWKAAFLCGTTFGLAVLTKGPLGLAFPAAVIGGEALVASRGRFWRLGIPWGPAGLASVLAVALPLVWYVPGYRAGGREFLETCLLGENFYMPVGQAQGIGVSHRKPFPYYLWYQIVFLLPMLPLLPETVRWLVRRGPVPARLSLGAWAVFGLILFMAAANKRHYYLLPLQPAFAGMIGLASDAPEEGDRRPLLLWGAGVTGVLLLLAGLAGAALGVKPDLLGSSIAADVVEAMRAHGLRILLFALLVGAMGFRLLGVTWRRGSGVVGAVLCLGLVTIAGLSVAADAVVRDLDRTKPFVGEMSAAVPRGVRPVVLPPFRGYGLDYYWPDRLIHDAAAAAEAPYVFVQRARLDSVRGPYEIRGVRIFGDRDREILLVQRK